jgi:pimeloyl-ACP methyl ester carboxylesterase
MSSNLSQTLQKEFAMSKWSDGTVNSNGLKIHYYRTGGDKPKVIFNHGAGDDGLCWTRVVKELENDYDVIMVDARGHGKTDSGKGDYSTAQRVADLAGLVQALGLDRPVVGGHSLGADTSMNFAALHPDMTRGIFLEDPPIIIPGEKFGDGKQKINMEDLGKMMAKFMRMFKLLPKFIATPMARKGSPTYPDDEIIPWVNAKKRVSFNFLNSISSMSMEVADPFEVFKKITVPVLLFIGDKEKMSIVSTDTAQKAASVNDKVKVVHLEGASHDIRRTRFDGYMPALKDFLKDIYKS